VRFFCFTLLVAVITAALGATDQLEAGLAACAQLPEQQKRAACEENVKRAAHCIGLEANERRQCIREAIAPVGPRDPCANARNREVCEVHQVTLEVCRRQPAAARAECERERRAAPVPKCDHSTGARGVECELYREAAQACSQERGQAARDCIDSRWVVRLLKRRFNPLDCGTTPIAPSLAPRCAARERVVRACASLSQSENRQCQSKFLPQQLEPQDCSVATDHRGSCLFHNRQLAVCMGIEGRVLDVCVSQAATQRSSAAINCSLLDLNLVEKRYCSSFEQTLEQCIGRFDDVLSFRSCVDDAIPNVLKLAAIAAGLRRIGPVH
jgi:hypothetical protein